MERTEHHPERNADTTETWNLCGICNEKWIAGREHGFNKMLAFY